MGRWTWVLALCVACGASVPKGAAPNEATSTPASCVSDATAHVLDSIGGALTVDAFFTPGHEKLDAFAARTKKLLREYERRGAGKIHLEIVSVTSDEAKARAEKEGLGRLELGDGASAYSGIALRYGSETDVIPVLAPDAEPNVEFWLTNKIRNLRDTVEKRRYRIGLATGNGEIALAEPNLVPSKMGKPSMKEVIDRNFSYFDLVDVDLGKPIDDGLLGLIVTQPAVELPSADLQHIDDFVMKGKALVVLASAVDVKAGDATMTATLALHGLDRLLGPYGVDVHRDVVLDFGGAYRVQVETHGGVAELRVPQLVELSEEDRRLDTSFPPLFRLVSLVAPFASSLTIHPERQPRASIRVVARTSDEAIVSTDSPIDLRPVQTWKPRGKWTKLDVGAVVEGPLASAFSRAVAPASARVFVLASSQVETNPFARAGNGPDLGTGIPSPDDPTLTALAGPYADLQHPGAQILDAILFLKNTLDWIALGVDAPGLPTTRSISCR